MRLTQAFFRTLKTHPHEAEVISHQLLERGGYLKKVGKGIYTYTPLMWRVLQKIKAVIRDELDKAGCQEISMPLLHPAELWQGTGRWDDFKSAQLLYTLTDREGHEHCLSPTHEEVVVQLVSNWITSHKQLPLNLYQIGTKFRDEIRPRFGLIRCKEFFMKDGYSFSSSPQGMEEQYSKMREAYSNIFKRLELDFVIVRAHGGKIGKGKSEEFQVRASIGEDAIMVADHVAANIEQTISIPKHFEYEREEKPLQKLDTPNISTIEDLAAFTHQPREKILKTMIFKLLFPHGEEFVAIGIRGDRQVNEVKVGSYFGALEILTATDEEIKKVTGARVGFAGPLHLTIPFYADQTCEPMKNFISAANIEDVHYLNVNWERECPKPTFVDFLLAEEGDLCPEGGVYKMQRGIEVGHIFNLGTLYSEKMEAFFQDDTGEAKPFWMGTYGIGVGRVAAACIEQKHDEKGILWPLAIAPYRLFITAASSNQIEQVKKAEELYHFFQGQGFEPLFDDRDERLGLKLKDSDLLGIPYKLIVGKSFLLENKFEIESRTGEKQILAEEELSSWAHRSLSF